MQKRAELRGQGQLAAATGAAGQAPSTGHIHAFDLWLRGHASATHALERLCAARARQDARTGEEPSGHGTVHKTRHEKHGLEEDGRLLPFPGLRARLLAPVRPLLSMERLSLLHFHPFLFRPASSGGEQASYSPVSERPEAHEMHEMKERAEEAALRHVGLDHGAIRLSEAWNVYFPARLPQAARRKLADPTVPFGAALGRGAFQRHWLAPPLQRPVFLPPAPPDTVLEHWAVLFLLPQASGHTAPRAALAPRIALAYVRECYTQNALNLFRQTRPPPLDDQSLSNQSLGD